MTLTWLEERIARAHERRGVYTSIIVLRMLIGFAFIPAGLKKLLGQPFTDPANTGVFHEFLHAFHATGPVLSICGGTAAHGRRVSYHAAPCDFGCGAYRSHSCGNFCALLEHRSGAHRYRRHLDEFGAAGVNPLGYSTLEGAIGHGNSGTAGRPPGGQHATLEPLRLAHSVALFWQYGDNRPGLSAHGRRVVQPLVYCTIDYRHFTCGDLHSGLITSQRLSVYWGRSSDALFGTCISSSGPVSFGFPRPYLTERSPPVSLRSCPSCCTVHRGAVEKIAPFLPSFLSFGMIGTRRSASPQRPLLLDIGSVSFYGKGSATHVGISI